MKEVNTTETPQKGSFSLSIPAIQIQISQTLQTLIFLQTPP
ncbi:hypothetical protein HanXRQr2_Chr10g0440061 [Helianthus annuus]|uniref:Uncharacterized protein n=1 Tax=Helianthus annuus TaxID=4232 RepID=A0A9K3N3V2_HELAN|nr:hypothetical protein HanXRQr2_Chr10g0440061 [Helianthus annuus]